MAVGLTIQFDSVQEQASTLVNQLAESIAFSIDPPCHPRRNKFLSKSDWQINLLLQGEKSGTELSNYIAVPRYELANLLRSSHQCSHHRVKAGIRLESIRCEEYG